jgi:hypothetical protein
MNISIYEISISADGKTLIITIMGGGETGGYWLTKK